MKYKEIFYSRKDLVKEKHYDYREIVYNHYDEVQGDFTIFRGLVKKEHYDEVQGDLYNHYGEVQGDFL